MTHARLFVSPFIRAGEQLEALALSEDPLKLKSVQLDGAVHLELRHQFRLVKEKDRRLWHVSTAAYYYQLSDNSGRELAAWHWHPDIGVGYPHAHVASGPIPKQVHLPTGRVSIESVLRLLLTELGVPPTADHREDHLDVLAASEGPFIKYRRWHSRGPDDEVN